MTQASSMRRSMHQPPAIQAQLRRAIDLLATFVLSAAAVLAMAMNVAFVDSFSNARLGVVLVVLVLFHLALYPKFIFCRESVAYALFVTYMCVQLLWTPDVRLATNTLVPAVDFILVSILFGSLVAYHNLNAVVTGMLAGILMGAGIYTLTEGFPFARPLEFSYNAIASMYLFGLFVTLLLISLKHTKGPLLIVALAFLLQIVATTSIKTNLGVLLGVVGAGLIYFKLFVRAVVKNAVALALFAAMVGYYVASNETVMQSVQAGIDRVALGVEILEARENLAGYSGFDNRIRWVRSGLVGWTENPIFGHGVEAFRSRYGITSHTTAVDLLYNSGLIGFLLFFYVFISFMWRLFMMRDERRKYSSALMLGTVICYLFMTLSGTMHYNAFLAAFIALGTVLLSRWQGQPSRSILAGSAA